MHTIKLRDKEYPILFDLNVMKEVQDRYKDIGGIAALGEKLRDFGEMAWIISLLISEGAEYQAYLTNGTAKKITAQQAGMLLTMGDFNSGKISQAVVDAFNESLGESGNVTAEDLTTVASLMQTEATAS
nr:MAG TPA: tail tube protein [Caudoviricetes sp.]